MRRRCSDGAVRDVAELKAESMPSIVAAIILPPSKAGAAIDINISCGGVVVKPGDLIVGDDDGIAVVPLERVEVV